MDVLRGKTPEMVRKEIYAYLLAYNLLRTVMWEAGTTHGVNPLRLSMQGTEEASRQLYRAVGDRSDKTARKRLYQTLLKLIVHKPVPERPGRSEPRVRKRRSKAYPVMQKPRSELRRQLAAA